MSDDLARLLAAVEGEDPTSEFVSALRMEIEAELLDDRQDAVDAVRFIDRSVEVDVPCGDDLMDDYLSQRHDESEVPSARKGWSGAVFAVAAAVLVVVGVVVVADGDTGDVVTDPASTPSADEPVATTPQIDSFSDLTWSRVPHDEVVFGGSGGQGMNSVTVGGPGLVAVGYVEYVEESSDYWEEHGDAAVWTSVDGITWSRVPYDEEVFGGAVLASVTAGGPGLVAVGYQSQGGPYDSDADAAVWTSVDGITWSRVPHDETIFGGEGEQAMTSVTVGGPGLVAVGSDGPFYGDPDAAVWTSPDGLTWTRVSHDDDAAGVRHQLMLGVTAGGPGLVAVGGEGPHDSGPASVLTSIDGITWTQLPHDEANVGDGEIRGVTSTASGLVAVGIGTRGPATWTSLDGITWSRVLHDETVFSVDMTSVTAGGPGVVAVGGENGAAVWTSTDGIAWTPVLVNESFSAEAGMASVTFGGPGFVVVGRDGDDAAVWVATPEN